MGFGVGGSATDFSFGFTTINGYQLNPHFSMGVGVGFDAHNERFMVPLFLDLRANFLKTRVSPLFSLGLGYSFIPRAAITQLKPDGSTYPAEGYKGGLFVNPSLGVKFFISKNTSLYFDFGFRLQDFAVNYRNFSLSGQPTSSYVTEYRSLYLTTKFGIVF